MLHTGCVPQKLLELLKTLMSMEDFNDLYLVGGTALALQIGHRESIDIDLFGQHQMDKFSLSQKLSLLGKVVEIGSSPSIQIYFVDNVKIDIVKYPYPLIRPIQINKGIRMASLPDIAAMKIAAITQRGSKKDFIDLYCLLKHFTLEEILEFYNQKISDGNSWLALRSLTFFDDAEQQAAPKLHVSFTWDEIKLFIKKEALRIANA